MSLSLSLSRSPPMEAIPSLLSPPNPATLLPELAPRGGILINHTRRASANDAAELRINTASAPTSPEIPKDAAVPVPASPGLPTTPTNPTTIEFVPGPSPVSERPPYSAKFSTGGSSSGRSPRIRFAPLPDPHRPRSKSTGRDIVWDATLDDDGVRTSSWSIRRDSNDMSREGDEDAVSDEEYDEDDKRERGRSWSKTMSVYSGWHGTKKLLGASGWTDAKDRKGKPEGTYDMGGPLKKSVSTGGFIGSSPFRWTSAEERKADMLGTSPGAAMGRTTSRERPAHARSGSFEPGTLGTSAPSSAVSPVRMLNGRMYGARRASEAAEAEKKRMQAMEPKFVEWGHGKASAGLGSNQSRAKSGEEDRFRDGDEEDGSGMEWVRRRRQERQRRESEAAARRLSTAGSLAESDFEETDTDQGRATSGASVDSHGPAPVTPPVESRSLPTPLIKVSEPPEPVSPETKLSSPVSPSRVEYVPPMEAPSGGANPVPVAAAKAVPAAVPSASAIDIAPGQGQRNDEIRGVDVWGSGEEAVGGRKGRRRSGEGGRPKLGNRRHSSDPNTEEEEDDDEDDDGDFEKDDEDEEEEQEMLRSTSAAAGVEKFHSRHERDG